MQLPGLKEVERADPSTRVHAPLSYGQEALWFLSRLAPTSRAYHLCGAARVVGPFDRERLQRSFEHLAVRHPALHTTFGEGEGGTPEQRVGDGPGLVFSHRHVDRDGDLEPHLAAELDAPFDLERGPLVRAGLITSEDTGETILWLAAHHLVADFWSLAVMLRDVGAAYANGGSLPPDPTDEAQLTYAQWTHWQRERAASEEGERELAEWKEALSGELPRLEIPTDRPRRGKSTWDGGAVDLAVEAEAVRALGKVARGSKSNLFSALVAAFQSFLARLSGQDDVIVGTPTTGRFGAKVADQVGYFVNPVPVRADLSGDPTFSDLLSRQRPTIQKALALQSYPFSRLAEEIQPERDAGRSPLFDAMFAYEKARGGEGFWGFALGLAGTKVDLGGLSIESLRVEPTGSPFDLSLAVSEVEGGLAGSLRYSSELFDRATVERWAGWWVRLVEGAAANPGLRLSDLPLLSESERTELLSLGASGPSADKSLSEGKKLLDAGFTEWEQRSPDALAVADSQTRWTYRELGERANAVAHRLRTLGIAEESRVAVCLDRSAAFVASLLGVLRAGAAFVPIDPAYPEDRRAAMVRISGASAILTSSELAVSWPEGPDVLSFDELFTTPQPPLSLPSRRADPDQLAYVIFTSGSTGTPKGVAISHRAAHHMTAWYGSRFGWTSADRGLQIAGPGFDATVFEIWPALAAGGSLRVPPEEVRLSPVTLLSWLAAEKVTVAFLPTPLAEAAFAEPPPEGIALRFLTVGGDRLHRGAPASYVSAGVRLVNMYGPAENSVVTTAGEVSADDPLPSIGRAIDGVRVYLLDRSQGLAPTGVVGELAAAGAGLARGYLGDPAQTADRFRPDPWGEPGSRLYRTGDLARWQSGSGEIEFLGRLDHQVKIRGQRIELGEIESALAALPSVRESAVLVHEASPGDRRLVAFVALAEGLGIGEGDLIETLRRRLSDAMVPRTFVRLERLPANANGKVDRKALAALAQTTVLEERGEGDVGVAPRTELEERVAAIWRELLGRERVGVEEDFFSLGGHSLLVTQLASRVRREFGVELSLPELFAGATVAGIAARVASEGEKQKLIEGSEVGAIERVARGSDDVPLSFAQERLWFVDRLEPGRATYNVGFRLVLGGELGVGALEAALAAVIARHEPLRTRYAQPGDIARQEIDPSSLSFSRWPLVDLAAVDARRAVEAARIGRREGRRPFDLARGPVWRAVLVRREPALHDAVFTFHHIAIDGWSLAVFSREIAEVYSSFVENRPARLPDLPISYADWAIWQRRRLSGERYLRELSWWRSHLQGAPEAIELPVDRPRPASPKRQAAQVRRTLPPQLARSIAARANAEASTPFMMLFAAWAGLLSRLGSGRDLVIGTPIANRNRAETEGLIGFFVNSLAIRVHADPSAPLRALLSSVREASVGAFAHQDFPFERLVAELGIARGGNVPAIYQVSFAFQNLPAPVMLPGLTTTVEELDGGAAKLDLGLVVTPVEDRLEAQLEIDLDLFDPATGARLLAGFERMARELAEAPERSLAEAELLGRAGRHQLLYEWNEGGEELPGRVIHDFVRRWARERPDALALESEHEPGRRYSWAELDAHTERVARRLAGLGVGPEKVVGVSIERSVDRVLAMVAIWKAGGCYLPIDPELPVERRRLLVVDSGAVVVVGRSAYWEDLTSGWDGWHGRVAPLLLSKEDGLPEVGDFGPEERPRSVVAENLAYLIYTSGSTGTPKGVGVSHRHAVGHFAAASGFYRMEGSDRVVQFASASFDVSMEQVGVALASGCTLVVRGPEVPNPLEISAWIGRLGLTVANLPTALWSEWTWAEGPLPEGLRLVITGGEAMTPAAADRFRKRMAMRPKSPVFYNGYGPTETVVTASCYDLRFGRLAESGSVSIGRLLPNRSGYVVDGEDRLAPLGGIGEMVLGGLLARGYLDRPDLTAERFRPNPFPDKDGERLYRTGDRVRQRGDGSFDYLGRLDQQIKIRGFRIEPGEIEAALEAHPQIKEAIVLARESPGTGKRLIAWVRGLDGVGLRDSAELRSFLKGRLPDYMVPAAIVEVDEWPLSPSGKIDRRALPDPAIQETVERIAPRTPTEEIVAGMFGELLGASDVGAEADFFALGGHSLLATQLASRIRKTFGIELPLAELFSGSTVVQIAERIEAASGVAQAPPLVRVERPALIPLSFAQERLWFLDRLDPGSSTYQIGFRLQVEGDLDVSALTVALGEIVARHEPLRTSFPTLDGTPRQEIAPAYGVPFPLSRIDLGALPESTVREEAARAAGSFGKRPFDLARGPVVAGAHVSLGAGSCELVFSFHHIATDGWSMALFSKELVALYTAAVDRRGAFPTTRPILPPLPIAYADFAIWQRRWLAGEVYERELSWWREHLEGAPEVPELPADRPRPARRIHPTSHLVFRELSVERTAALEARARAAGATPFMVLLAGWAGLLSRLGAGADLVIGTPVANRNRAETEGLIGFFVNSLPLRIQARLEDSLDQLVASARTIALAAYAHQDFPFERLVAELPGARGSGAPPIFSTSLVVQNVPETAKLPGVKTRIVPLHGGGPKVDLGVGVSPIPEPGGERYSIRLEIDLDLYDPATGARLLSGFEAMLREMAERPEIPLLDAQLISREERHQLLIEGVPEASRRSTLLLPDFLARNARERPDDWALESEHEPARRATWREVDALAEGIAHRLAALGAGPERVVGVSLEWSVDRPLAVWAIWKAGACYLPVDPELPVERRALLLRDAGVVALITRDELWHELSAAAPDLIETQRVRPLLLSHEGTPLEPGPEAAPTPALPENLAYILYTSGSTGTPKGVGVAHAEAAVHLAAMVGAYRMGRSERILQFAAASFDVSMEQIGIALTSGGTLVVRGPVLPAPAELSDWLGRLRITQAHISTAIWNEWGWSDPESAALPSTLRSVIVGGEAMGAAAAGRFARLLRASAEPPVLWNGYGPTETVIDATLQEVRIEELGGRATVPVGRLLPHRSGYVADSSGAPLPRDGRGELLLGGLLARGYLGRPDLTAERFRPDGTSSEPGARVYWTGDRARRVDGEAFEFLGRLDHQIKIRGIRIEPGEIEAALSAHPRIMEAIVLARGASSDLRLIAWWRPRAEGVSGPLPSSDELRRFLAGRLPDFMIPAAFVEIPEWPKTATGKVDRKMLPEPAAVESATRHVPPRTPTEEIVAGAFAELLSRDGTRDVGPIGAESDFFALGGHSLLATQLASRLRRAFEVELPLSELFVAGTVAEIAARIDGRSDALRDPVTAQRPLERAERRGNRAPLSFAQERLWFLDRLEPGRATYNVGFRLTLSGSLDLSALGAAVATVVARHEPLRSRIVAADPAPVAEIAPPEREARRLSTVDLGRLAADGIEEREATRIARSFGRRPFDLARRPLFRPALVVRGRGAFDALFSFHHVATDGWSTAIFSREFAEAYAAAIERRPARFAVLPMAYSDWAAWQREVLSGARYEAELSWWRETLRGAPERLELPFDRPAGLLEGAARRRAAWVGRDLDGDLRDALERRARAQGATLFMTLLASWAGLLSRFGAGRDLVIGVPVANRNRAEMEGLIGLFVNSLALRIATDGASLGELLARVRRAALAAYAHQDFPFDRLVAEIAPARGTAGPPIYQTLASLQNLPEPVTLPGVECRVEELGGDTAKLDLSLVVLPKREVEIAAVGGGGEGDLRAFLELNLDRFDPATGARLLAAFERMAEAVAGHPERALSEVEVFGPAERHQMLCEWNASGWERGGERAADVEACVHDFVARWAREQPEAIALESEHEPERRVSWAELDAHTEVLARRLVGLGVGPETVVAVSLDWSVDRVLAMVAVWKAGGCYLPVDPVLPMERQRLLVVDSGTVVVVSRGAFWEGLTSEWEGWIGRVVPLLLSKEGGLPEGEDFGAEVAPRRVEAENLAYLIYTSGSTGKPKGVGVAHGEAVRHFASSVERYGWSERDRVALLGAMSFDLSVDQVGCALAAGATLVVRGPEMPAPSEFSAWLERLQISCVTMPTPLFAEWTRSDRPLPEALRMFYAGGEAMPAEAASRLRERVERGSSLLALNAYGPTEAVVAATCHDVLRGALPEVGSVSIGRLLPGRAGFVVDEVGNPVPLGGIGELALGGLLARGYLDRPDLTAERFRPNPFTDAFFGARLYRTGDRVRQRGDGTFDHLGRLDQQIKIRGFRIELGEIEAALAAHPQVIDSIVAVRETPAIGKRLVGWVRLRAEVRWPDLRSHLAKSLPEYMVPSAFVEVEVWPLTPSGKIDRRALPDPVFDGEVGERTAPRTPIEEIVAGVFGELLGIDGGGGVGVEGDFFALGGHSLLATRLVSRVREVFGIELPLTEVFARSTVGAVAAAVEEKLTEGKRAEPIARGASESDEVPLSFAQERLWFLDRLEPGSAAYNIGFGLALEGALSVPALDAALSAVVARHEPLRTRYVQVGDLARQIVDPPPISFSRFPCVDLQGISVLGSSGEAARIGGLLGRRPFDLARGPVVRVLLVRRGPTLHDAIFSFHHIAIDGWSMSVFSREIAEAYTSFVEERAAHLPELPISYSDWTIWQRRQLSGPYYERELAWWKERLAGAPEAVELPADRPRPSGPKRRAALVHRSLAPKLARAVRTRANAEASTPFMMLFAAWAGLLSRLGSGRDLVIGSPIANRNRSETEGLIGFFVNSLALRIPADPSAPLRSLLTHAREASIGAFAHQDFPFERLVAELGVARGGNVPPVYQVSFAFQNLPDVAPEAMRLPGLETTVRGLSGGAAKLDLALVVSPAGDGWLAELELNTDLFDPATGARLLAGFERMARAVAEVPERPLAEAELLGRLERHQLLYEWNEGGEELPARVVHDFVRRWAREKPEALALESEHEPGRRVSWAELDGHTDRLARRLAGLGVGPEKVVGVSLERSVDRVLAMIAIWKAGGCYLPVDPELPVGRRRLLVVDSGAVVLVGRSAFWEDLTSGWEGWHGRVAPLLLSKEDGLPEGEDFGAEECPRSAVAENLAYLIYTSGSTGTPKGVGVSHRHAVGHFAAASAFYGMDGSDRVVQFASASFDVSMEQVGVALASGGPLMVRGPEMPNPSELSAWLERWGVTIANLPTAVWTEWSWGAEPLPPSLKVLITGGEAMAPAAAERFRRRLEGMDNPPVVYNGYGPTETVVTATCYDLSVGRLPESGSVSIGRLLPKRTGYVVDEADRLVPLGGIGELVLGGLLARGYLDRPDLTAERFRPNPFTDRDGERLYRTGDRVRQRGDGGFDYLGRLDQQIKIRGFRIEPGEIEAALEAHPQIKEAIVLARESAGTGKRLIAWVRWVTLLEGGEREAFAELRTYLSGRLPAYMVPSAIVAMEEWPLTPSGKVDRRALPDPDLASNVAEGIALRTPTEEIVAGLFAELLGAVAVGAEADFFALGGHSLLATRLVSRIRGTFGVEMPLSEVFSGSTVAQIAARIDAQAGRSHSTLGPIVARERSARLPLSFAQERLWFLDRLEPESSAYNVGFRLSLAGEVSAAALAGSLAALAERHEPLRTRFEMADGRPVQRIDSSVAISLPRIDLSGLGRRSGPHAEGLAARWGRQPFDLARGPVFRAVVVHREARRDEAWFLFHHIATDGWSTGVFSHELVETYSAALERRPARLAPLAIGYADWAIWQREVFAGEVYARELAWWRERLAGAPQATELPVDRPRPARPSKLAQTVRLDLPANLSASLAASARSFGATPYMVLLAGWTGLLSRLGAGRDLIVGLPIANRNRIETEGLVGFFVNTLAIRLAVEAERPLDDLLRAARSAALDAYAHQDFPFDRLVAELGGARGGAPPLFSVSLMLQNLPEPVLLSGVPAEIAELGGGRAKLDLSLALVAGPDAGLRALLELDLDLFDPATGARMLSGFVAMLGEIVGNPGRRLAEVELLGPSERHQLLVEWNDLGRELPPTRVHDWIARHAAERPEAIALESEHEPGRRYTWREVAARTDRLARRLASLGAGPERVVGVSLERSVDRVLAIYAIWKAGACYLPVDPELPVERRALLLGDARAMALIAREAFFVDLPLGLSGPGGAVAPLLLGGDGMPLAPGPEETPRAALAENLAYLLYTSGSTGTPKGVAISHRHAAGHFAAAASFYRMDPTDRVVQFAAASFDVSMEQIGVALASGGALFVRGPELPNPLELSAWMDRHRITNANLPTAVWTEWSRAEDPLPEGLRVLVTGGEAMTPAAAERFRKRMAMRPTSPVVYNGYGPTETVVTATCQDLSVGRLADSGSVSIGRLLPDRTGYVVDEGDRLAPLGGTGELVLGGLLARGYLDRPDLTAERFRPNPFADKDGERLYRTGDRVRQRGDGSFDYLGRIDQQIKIRGFRIEPGEIEAALEAHPTVVDAIVLAREMPGAGKRLIAWYRPPEISREALSETAATRAAEIRRFLSARLPEYMVPAAFVEILGDWPVSATGKIDRRALPEPTRTETPERTAPRTAVQRMIASFWRDALPELGDDLAIEDSFFEIGGHSLLAVQVASKVSATFQVDLPLKRLFEAPTIEGLEAAVLAVERRPEQSEKIARVLLRMREMSPEAREKVRAAGS